MSDDLIKRSDAIKALYKYSFVSKDVIEREINAIPSADRPQGEWIEMIDCDPITGEPYPCGVRCSNCGDTLGCVANFRPNCGAKMDGGGDV